MTRAQCESAAEVLRSFLSSGWARKVLGEKQMQAFRTALWALGHVIASIPPDER